MGEGWHKSPRFQLGLVLWLVAMAGVAVLTVTVVPQLLDRTSLAAPLWLVLAASAAQSAVLVALAVWAGVALSRQVGLCAPVVEAALTGKSVSPVLKSQIMPSLIGGFLAAAVLYAAARLTPADLAVHSNKIDLPLLAKLLYGGVTEEVLLRWGAMTALAWLGWRVFQRRVGSAGPIVLSGAIFLAALLFGVLHLPAVVAMGASLSPQVIAYTVIGNMVPGVLFGILYWRYGLESSILAHAFAHAIYALPGGA